MRAEENTRFPRAPVVVAVALWMALAGAGPAWAAVIPGDEAPAASDSWYYDLATHWSRPYVLTLWEEGVTDGYPFPIMGPGWDWTYGYDFRPDHAMSRGQLLLMMSRVFDKAPDPSVPSPWPDLPPGYLLYGKPVYAEIRAAAEAWEIAPPGGSIRPGETVTRMYSVSTILSALGLDDYAVGLSPAEIDDILADFSDAGVIAPRDRPEAAAAVDLGLIIGYDDETLRLGNEITRAEGATILDRSCLMRLHPEHERFFPDGDGHREELGIEATGLRNASNVRWHVTIEDRSGSIYRHLPTTTPADGDPHAVTWDGYDDEGDPVTPGRYFVGGWAEDRRGNVFGAVRVPVELVHRTLEAALEPGIVDPEESLRVEAATTGSPLGVRLATGSGTESLQPLGGGEPWDPVDWRLDTSGSELGLAVGVHEMEVIADFGPVERRVQLTLEIDAGSDEDDDSGGDPGDGDDGDPDGGDGWERSDLTTILVR